MSKFILVLDPGHGGEDPGAVGIDGVKEADLNLKLANRVYQLLANYFTVVFTRRDLNETRSLKERSVMIKQLQPDLVLSIHHNAFTDYAASGLEVYYKDNGPERTKTRSKKISESIYASMGLLAEHAGYSYKYRGVKTQNLHMLRESPCPACLIEAGFLTNPKEVKWCNSPMGQISLGYAIAKSIVDYQEKLTVGKI